MKILCVAEKPSIAKAVAQHLGGGQVRNNQASRAQNQQYIRNYEFTFDFPRWGSCEVVMTSVAGHLESQDFEDRYKSWSSCTPDALFEAGISTYIEDQRKFIATNIERHARNSQKLFIWTDCDREGEHIGSEIRKVASRANSRLLQAGNVARARFSNIERQHVINAARNPIELDDRQANAVSARMELDLRIGACFTRLLTLNLKSMINHISEDVKVISYGSCQFPTLGFVVDRYFQVQKFVPEPFWSIKVMHTKDKINVRFSWARNRLFDRMTVVILFERCLAAKYASVTRVQQKPASKWRPLPLTTVELQKMGSRYLRMDSQRVMTVAEKLYNRGFISYPRTETDRFDRNTDLRQFIQNQTQSTTWGNYALGLLDGGYQFPREGRNDDKAHPPIHPVSFVNPSILEEDERKVLEFVVRRFLACCSEDAVGSRSEVEILYGSEIFKASGLTVLKRNYLDIYVYEKWTSTEELPHFEVGETFEPDEARINDGKTAKPGYLTEPELISLMDANGIGTDATMAEHIAKIKDRQYVKVQSGTARRTFGDEEEDEGQPAARTAGGRGRPAPIGEFIPTTLGVALYEGYENMGFETSLTKPHLRKEMEIKMKEICNGRATKAEVVYESLNMHREVYMRTTQRMDVLKTSFRRYVLGENGLERDNGLRRIRQAPPTSRKASDPNPRLPRNSSFNLNLSQSQNPSQPPSISNPSGPPSPVLQFSEDLARFPQESLHSFSFAQQIDSSLHSRQNVLKRSIDFIRDRGAWAAGNPGILDAHARVTGDEEVQTMLDLLKRANLMGPGGSHAGGMGVGPLTGPAIQGQENLFEKSFVPISESPTEDVDMNGKISPAHPRFPATSTEQTTATVTVARDAAESLTGAAGSRQSAGVTKIDTQNVPTQTADDPSPLLARRSQLKRTFTDIAGYSLQDRLSTALAKPYLATSEANRQAETLISPRFPPGQQIEQPKRNMTIPSNGAPHTHGTRQNAAAQAIFTTDTNAPWTITAANDLACLVFGVTRAEVRKMGIMEVIRPERRKWLETKLRPTEPEPTLRRSSSKRQADRSSPSPSPSTTSAMGNGVTAKLLSKPPARQTYQSRRARTADGAGVDTSTAKLQRSNSFKDKSRGVLLCGDVVPIQKRNGAVGSATLWVKEKQGGLIWVLEEIAEDVANLSLDDIGCVTKGEGAIEAIFGLERVRRGMDVQKILPKLPKQRGTHTGALDWDEIQMIRRYTARTANGCNIPVTVDLIPDEPTIRVSSFPHIAGIMVLSSQTLEITSSNSVFSAALFGHDNPDGLHITKLVPQFDKLLSLISDEDSIELKDGIVIPEHSFRRARALLAVKDGRADAAAFFLHPTGLPATHRDGSEIMVDVQMRVVKSEPKPAVPQDTIAEEQDSEPATPTQSASTVSFALWITYSKSLHAVNHSMTPITATPLMISRPGTPPHQPSPGQASPNNEKAQEQEDSGYEGPNKADVQHMSAPPTPTPLSVQLQEASSSPLAPALETELFEHPSPAALAAGAKLTKKKLIADFVILEEMGKGAYGEVKLVRYKKSNAQKMVIKYVTKRRILVDTWTRDRKLGTVPLEIHVLDYLRKDGLQHPNIVEMADFFEDDINYYIEMIPHGLPGVDLFDYIELRVNMEERECRSIFVQVAAALHHLHVKARVVHRDIKDENVILDGEGRVKLADFGSAAYIKSGPFDVFVGTIDYAAPEVLRGSPYRGKEQDVWALGILLYTIVYKENPFYSIDEIMDHDLRVPYVMSEDCLDLIRKMLDRDVERRIGIQDVVNHPWCLANEEVGPGDGRVEQAIEA
ncbi:DNA topoisomerase-like protein [Elsinoe fawcettii]|nr:DNA topoisomerase-like protein [Elsinoe fawcettii]